MSVHPGQSRRRLTRARAGLVALVAMTAIGGSQAASAAPKDKVDMVD